jgi:hypothetical protein
LRIDDPAIIDPIMPLTTQTLHASFAALFAELVDGPSPHAAYMLNSKDPGLLQSLDRLSAAAASSIPAAGGASVAAHVDHVRYGLELMNRWSNGEADPWSNADWTASWRRTTVTTEQWAALRGQLRQEVRRWGTALRQPRDWSEVELNSVIASIAHLAYHLGAIRQIDRSIRGPQAA